MPSSRKHPSRSWWRQVALLALTPLDPRQRAKFKLSHSKGRSQTGLTMIELLVAITIVATLALIFIVSMRVQLGRSRDAQRKGNLEKIKVAFEDYYNDYECYPQADALVNCGSGDLQPYMDKVLCDPYTKQPYVYVPEVENGCSRRYRLLTSLENQDDEASIRIGCATSCGCGVPGYEEYNFGLSSGMSVVGDTSSCTVLYSANSANEAPAGSSSPQSSSSPGPGGGSPSTSPDPIYVYACDPGGVCNQYEEGHPALVNCPDTFPTSTLCEQNCSPTSPFRCSQ